MIDLGKIERLMAMMVQFGMDVVEAQSGGEKVAIARNSGSHGFFQRTGQAKGEGGSLAQSTSHDNSEGNAAQNVQQNFARAQSPSGTGNALQSNENAAPTGARAENSAVAAAGGVPGALPAGTLIKSPFVGTFYAQSSPDSPKFAEVGTKVRKGQTLCIVEAMKLMNEIESELDGTVVAVLVENGKPVEFETPLFVIAP